VGGDELFGGYRRYLGNHYAARFDRLPGWVRKGAIRAGEMLPSDRHSGVLNVMRLAKGFLSSAELSFEERYRAYVQVFSREWTARLLRDPGPNGIDPIHAAFERAGSDDALNRMLAVDGDTQLPDDLLMLTDKMSMAVSLECRVPLLDHELVELAAAMPESIKVRGGQLKHAMKGALEGLLPLDILHRKKRGFGTPMGAWLKGELSRLLDDVLSERAVAARGLFRYDAIRELIAAHRHNREDCTDQLLSIMNLEIWARMYLDRRSPEDVAEELTELCANG
jgi:asparagine synthase (glutamine-hydrolysing)